MQKIVGLTYGNACGITPLINKNTNTWLPFFIANKNIPLKWENNNPTNGLPAKGEFSSVSCMNNPANKICVAAGYSSESEPLLATSKDDGITWNIKFNSHPPLIMIL